MSLEDDIMIEQEKADALWNMGEAEWRKLNKGEENEQTN